jgi:cytochrome c oxidase cbb3-type subunit 2
MRIPIFFAGIFGTFAFAWYGQTLVPQAQLGSLQPQTDEEGGDIYPVNNNGIAARGRQVYVSEGCFYCHTQQVRDAGAGSDLDRKWGTRRTVARDYIYDNPVVLGVARYGPDLANEGIRQVDGKPLDAMWHYMHLYDPRTKSEGSIMPSYRYLFKKQKIQGQRSDEALPLEGEDSVEDGYEVVPTEQAKALVAYLMSLDRSHPLKEVKQEAPAK